MTFEAEQLVLNRGQVQQHFEGILANWSKRWNNEHGGFDCYVRDDGSLSRPGERRPLVMQARLLYNFSEGILHGYKDYAALAAQAYAYMVQEMRVEQGWYKSLGASRDRRDAEHFQAHVLNAYDNLFVVIAFAIYSRASQRAEVGVEALRLFSLINELCGEDDLSVNGIRAHYRDVGAESPSNSERWGGHYSGNVMLHYLEAVVNLEESGLGAENRQLIAALRTLFLTAIYDEERGVVHDYFKGSFAEPHASRGARTSQGHALEWIDFFRVVDGTALSEQVERNLLDSVAQRAIAETGLFVNMYFYQEAQSAGSVDFWGQSESIKTYNLATSIYGYPYAEYGRNLMAAYFKYFVDSDQGVFMSCDRNGVVMSRRKGDAWKCDYHSVRMCIDLLDRKGGFLSA